MEYVPGGDAGDFLRALKDFDQIIPEELTRNYMAQLVLALEWLHSHNIIHKDIKLDNLFLDGPKLKLGDFGLAVNVKDITL